MPRASIAVDSIGYLVAPDDPPARGWRPGLLAGVRLLDELTGAPPAGPVAVSPGLVASTMRAADGGLCGLVGVPARALPALAAQPVTVPFDVSVDRFMPRSVAVVVPQDPTFPATFTPPPIADLALHRQPTVIHGRVVSLATGRPVPVAGAAVTLMSLWRTLPPTVVDPPNLVALNPPLYADRSAATGNLTELALTPVLGDDKVTLDDLPAGTSQLRLSNRLNLGPGDLLVLDPADPGRREYLSIKTMTGASTADQPATFTADLATARAHPRGTVARKVNPGGAGAARAVAVDGWRGDPCLFLANVAGLGAAFTVRVDGGTAPAEYHDAATYQAVSDVAGFYRLPLISRVAQVDLRATAGPKTVDRTFQPDYSLEESDLDFVFS
jgi:hypothetical protein